MKYLFSHVHTKPNRYGPLQHGPFSKIGGWVAGDLKKKFFVLVIIHLICSCLLLLLIRHHGRHPGHVASRLNEPGAAILPVRQAGSGLARAARGAGRDSGRSNCGRLLEHRVEHGPEARNELVLLHQFLFEIATPPL